MPRVSGHIVRPTGIGFILFFWLIYFFWIWAAIFVHWTYGGRGYVPRENLKRGGELYNGVQAMDLSEKVRFLDWLL